MLTNPVVFKCEDCNKTFERLISEKADVSFKPKKCLPCYYKKAREKNVTIFSYSVCPEKQV